MWPAMEQLLVHDQTTLAKLPCKDPDERTLQADRS